ncbi:MAG TPA: hypothetical protein VGI39_19665 [Polyangiaceae bacterium]|jgi:hypothetical protein
MSRRSSPRRSASLSLRAAAIVAVPVVVGAACASSPANDGSESRSDPLLFPPIVLHLPQLDATHSVLTQHNGPTRSGAYTSEGTLKPANVKGATASCFQQAPGSANCYAPGFGELAVRPTVGDMAAQPLYAHAVNTSKGVKNLVIATTRENYVYAFDADSVDVNPASYIVWSEQILPNDPVNLPNAIPSMVLPDVNNFTCQQTKQHVGITSTPVIDPISGNLYVVYRTGTAPGVEPVQAKYWLRAINLHDGSAVTLPHQSSPDVLIQGADSIPARGGGEIVFNPVLHLNRPGLLLQNDPTTGHPILYVAFGSAACDRGGDPKLSPRTAGNDGYYPLGWVFAYDMTTLESAAFATMRDDPQKYGDTIWQSGNGLLGDGQYVYFFTGNATTPSNAGDYSGGLNEALVKLQATTSPLKLNFVSHWQDPDVDAEDTGGADADLGAAGPMIVPGTNLIVGGGKPGTIFAFSGSTTLLQRQPLGAVNTYCSQTPVTTNCSTPPDISGVCPCPGTYAGGQLTYDLSQVWGPNLHVGPVGWQSSNGNSYIYSMAEKDYLRSYPVTSAGVNFSRPLTSPIRSNWGMPGGHLSVSGNGGTDGIVWALHYEANDKVPDWASSRTPSAAAGGITSGTYSSYHGVLYALDAVNLGMLYKDDAFHSEVPASAGAGPGTCAPGSAGCGQFFSKFTVPTIADGKVFRPTYTGTLSTYQGGASVPTGTYTGELFVYGQNSVPPTVVSNSTYGEMVAFEVDDKRTLNYAVQSAPNNAFQPWIGLSGNVKSSPAALDLGDGRVEVYFVSGNNAMFCAVGIPASTVRAGFNPTSPDAQSNSFNYSPALVRSASGALTVFAVNTLGQLMMTTDDGECDISGWSLVANGPFASTPAVGKNANGTLDVFLLDDEGSMWSVAQAGAAWAATKFPDGTDFASGPVVASERDGRLAVFAVDAGGGLRHIWQTTPSGAFTGWSATGALMGAPFSTPPAVASNADGTLEVLAIDGNGNFQRQRQAAVNVESWATSWETLGLGCTSSPAIGHNADGRLEAFAICPETVNGRAVWGLAHTWQMTVANEPNEFQAGLSSLAIPSWPPWQRD